MIETLAQFENIGKLQNGWQDPQEDMLVGITNKGKRLVYFEDNTFNLYLKGGDEEWLSIELYDDRMNVMMDSEWAGDERYDNVAHFKDITKGWAYVDYLTKLGDFIHFRNHFNN